MEKIALTALPRDNDDEESESHSTDLAPGSSSSSELSFPITIGKVDKD
jgi:hypothetical protein